MNILFMGLCCVWLIGCNVQCRNECQRWATAVDRDAGAHEAHTNCRPGMGGSEGRRFVSTSLLGKGIISHTYLSLAQ